MATKKQATSQDLSVYETVCGPLFAELRRGQENIKETVAQVLAEVASLKSKLTNGVTRNVAELDESIGKVEIRLENEVKEFQASLRGVKKAFWSAMAIFGLASVGWIVTMILQVSSR